jgi:hypothetical protein
MNYLSKERFYDSPSLVHAKILDVDIAAEAGIEEQIPAGVVVVVVNVNAIALPLPVATAVQVVGSNYPIGIVIEDYAACVVIDPAGDKVCPDVLVAAVRISTPRADAVVFGIPVGMGIMRIVPTLVIAIVVAVAVVVSVIDAGIVFFRAFVLAVVVALIPVATIVAILRGCGNRQRPSQSDVQ